MTWLLLSTGLALANPTAQELAQGMAEVRAAIDAHAVYKLEFTDDELQQLSKEGGIARRWEKLDGADRVIGLTWTDVPRDQLWVAIQDDDNWDGVVEGLSEETLPDSVVGHKWLFQHVDLPWPFANRQWLIEITNNTTLVEKSGGAVWERTWVPSDRRDAKTIEPDAVWVEVNDGGWFLVQVGGGTLLSYHARTVVGGNIPDRVATRYAYSTLDNMLLQIVERAEAAAEHYSGDHKLLYRPDGSPISVFQ